MRKRITYILILTLTLIFILSSSVFAAVSREQQAKLWSDLVEAKANPALSKLGKWNVIEGMTLIKKVDDVSLKAAALATIIHYYDAKEEIWYGKEVNDKTTEKWSPRKKILIEDAEKHAEKYRRHLDDLQNETTEIEKEFKGKKYTSGVNISGVIEKYLKRNRNDIARAARDFAANRGLDIEVIVRDDLNYDDLINFIDNKNPIILQQTTTDNYLICVGYIRHGTDEYLITVDLNKIMFTELSRADLVVGKGKWAQKSREISKEYDKTHGLIKGDLTIKYTGGMQPGIEITDYRSGSYTAYVIKNFKLTEESFEKYLKSIKAK
jgi:hypothetical protein